MHTPTLSGPALLLAEIIADGDGHKTSGDQLRHNVVITPDGTALATAPRHELVVTFDHLGAMRSPKPLVISINHVSSTTDLDLQTVLDQVTDYAAMYVPYPASSIEGDITEVAGRLYANHRATSLGQFVMNVRVAS